MLLPRSLAFFVEWPDLHHLLPIFHSLLFGKIEGPENVEHTPVFALYGRANRPTPVPSRFVDQPMGQGRTYPPALPTILHERRVLGPFVPRLAGVAYDGGDLAGAVALA